MQIAFWLAGWRCEFWGTPWSNKSDANPPGGDTKPPVQGAITHEVCCLASQWSWCKVHCTYRKVHCAALAWITIWPRFKVCRCFSKLKPSPFDFITYLTLTLPTTFSFFNPYFLVSICMWKNYTSVLGS